MAKWLLELPGVDINGRNDMGRTVLMTMIYEAMGSKTDDDEENLSCPLSDQLLEEICEMIDMRKADPTLVDNKVSFTLYYCF